MGVREQLKDFGRGATGALVFGTPFLLTMETWWLGATGPPWLILSSGFGAIVIVVGLARHSGYKYSDENQRAPPIEWLLEAASVVFQSFLAAYVVLSLYGIIRWSDPWQVIVRMGMVQMIALSLGAALANRLFHSAESDSTERQPFPAMVAIFSLGALYFILHLAVTEETAYLAAQAGWWRLLNILFASLLVAHLLLFELQESRRTGGGPLLAWGQSFMVLFLAMVVAASALAAFGAFMQQPPEVWLQKTLVLSPPAAIGGSAARVVL